MEPIFFHGQIIEKPVFLIRDRFTDIFSFPYKCLILELFINYPFVNPQKLQITVTNKELISKFASLSLSVGDEVFFLAYSDKEKEKTIKNINKIPSDVSILFLLLFGQCEKENVSDKNRFIDCYYLNRKANIYSDFSFFRDHCPFSSFVTIPEDTWFGTVFCVFCNRSVLPEEEGFLIIQKNKK